MEEVDSIILHFLRNLNISIDEEIKNIRDIPVQTIIQSVAKCINSINPSAKIPTILPPGISQRIELATQIASACKDLGYKNDVGYQTFLYYNESELRHVFMYLIEKLPNEGKQSLCNSTSLNKKSLLKQKISNKINEDMSSVWIPPSCVSHSQPIGDFSANKGAWTTSSNKLVIPEEELINQLIKANNQALNETRVKTEKINQAEESTDLNQAVKIDKNKSLRELKELSLHLRQKLDTLESERHIMNVEMTQAYKSYERVKADFENVQEILKGVGVTDINSEDLGDKLFERVKNNVINLHRKSDELTSKNLSLIVEIDKLKNSLDSSESERVQCKKVLNNLKETAKSMKEEYGKKEEMLNQVKTNYEKLKGGNKRHVYTKRILEIISNVDKQNIEILKILEDTRQLQKEINNLEGQLDRCFSIADETLFRDAKRDDQAKKAYKLLALLHSECNSIVSMVNETGNFARDIVDLEDNIKAERAKRVDETLNKIQHDLIKLHEESNM